MARTRPEALGDEVRRLRAEIETLRASAVASEYRAIKAEAERDARPAITREDVSDILTALQSSWHSVSLACRDALYAHIEGGE